MKSVVLPILLLLGLLFSFNNLSASIVGGEITYRCKGGDKYEILVKAFRDCNGSNLSQSNLIARCMSDTILVTQQTKISTRDITGIGQNCGTSSACSGTFPYGFEEVICSMELDLSTTTCCEWTVSWSQCCRSSAFTTGSAGQDFYTYAQINKCLSACNSSPVALNDPLILTCHNQDLFYSMTVIDTIDVCDSISYSLATAWRGANSSVTYIGNYSPYRPLAFFGFPNYNLNWPAGFRLDPITGELLFRPTSLNQVAIIAVDVKEWRKINGVMTVIGISHRELPIFIISCANKIPYIRPMSMQACAGQKSCIPISTDDDDVGDTVRITWSGGIPGATFTSNNGSVLHASGEVCWTPHDSDVCDMPYIFTVTAKDNACPLYGITTRSFSFYVRETLEAELFDTALSCGRVAMDYQIKQMANGLWSTYKILDTSRKQLWTSTQKMDTALLKPGKYYLQLVLKAPLYCNIILEDTLLIEDYVQVDLGSDRTLCAADSLYLFASIRGGSGFYQYSWWNRNDSSVVMNADTFLFDLAMQDNKYWLFVSDLNGCFHSDSITTKVSPLPLLSLTSQLAFCSGDSVQIDAKGDSLGWKYDWSTSDTSQVIWIKKPAKLTLRVEDIVGCESFDSIQIVENSLQVSGLYNPLLCEQDTAIIKISGAPNFSWFKLDSYVGNGQDVPIYSGDSLNLKVKENLQLLVVGSQDLLNSHCEVYDTVTINVNPLPLIDAGIDQTVCPRDTVELAATGADSYRWYDTSSYQTGASNNAVSQDSSFIYQVAQGNQWLIEGFKTENGLQCMGIDSVSVNAYSAVAVENIVGDDQSLSTAVKYIYSVYVPGQRSINWLVQNGSITRQLGLATVEVKWNATGVGSIQVQAVSNDGCYSVATKIVSIIINSVDIANEPKFRIYPNPGSGIFSIEIEDEAGEPEYLLLNSLGQVVHSGSLTEKVNIINLNQLPAGVYVVRVKGMGEQRLVIIE